MDLKNPEWPELRQTVCITKKPEGLIKGGIFDANISTYMGMKGTILSYVGSSTLLLKLEQTGKRIHVPVQSVEPLS